MNPQVNEECEYTFKAHNEPDYCEWDRCTVMYLSKYGVVIKEAWGAEAFFDYEHYDLLFRPVPTERDNFAVDVVSLFAPLTASYKETSMIAEVARKMYDRGYRKVMSRENAEKALIEVAHREFHSHLDKDVRNAFLDALGYE